MTVNNRGARGDRGSGEQTSEAAGSARTNANETGDPFGIVRFISHPGRMETAREAPNREEIGILSREKHALKGKSHGWQQHEIRLQRTIGKKAARG